MMLVLLLACQGDDPTARPSAPVPTADTASAEPTPAPVERPELHSPAEAIDLDPAPDVLHVALTAAPHRIDGVDGYAYNGQVPGPTLRARVGDTLRVELDNQLPMPTTLHWHGLDVPFAMDGAGWQVAPVPAGGSFVYTFTLEQAGTFWYHPHFDTAHQVDRGLYGVVIVEEPTEPITDELVVVFDASAEVEASAADPTVDPTPLVWTLNGATAPVWRPESGTTVRMRLLNASNSGYVAMEGVRVIARDQGLLGAEETSVVLAPGDRAEVELSVGPEEQELATVPWSIVGVTPEHEGRPVLSIEPHGTGAPPTPVEWPFASQPPTSDPLRTDLRYTFTGSALGGWEINGATWPAIIPDVVPLGSEQILEIRNPSPANHPFHLHGMTFEVLSVDGVAPPNRVVEDTLDIGVQQTVRLRILADNPGDWMSHCHILPHAEDGMMTVLSVQ